MSKWPDEFREALQDTFSKVTFSHTYVSNGEAQVLQVKGSVLVSDVSGILVAHLNTLECEMTPSSGHRDREGRG